MSEIFIFKNLKFKIWPNELEPPNVHVHGPDSFTKINLDTLEIMKASGFSEKDLKIIQQQIFKRRSKISEKWDEFNG
jgi:hypothetical protein